MPPELICKYMDGIKPGGALPSVCTTLCYLARWSDPPLLPAINPQEITEFKDECVRVPYTAATWSSSHGHESLVCAGSTYAMHVLEEQGNRTDRSAPTVGLIAVRDIAPDTVLADCKSSCIFVDIDSKTLDAKTERAKKAAVAGALLAANRKLRDDGIPVFNCNVPWRSRFIGDSTKEGCSLVVGSPAYSFLWIANAADGVSIHPDAVNSEIRVAPYVDSSGISRPDLQLVATRPLKTGEEIIIASPAEDFCVDNATVIEGERMFRHYILLVRLLLNTRFMDNFACLLMDNFAWHAGHLRGDTLMKQLEPYRRLIQRSEARLLKRGVPHALTWSFMEPQDIVASMENTEDAAPDGRNNCCFAASLLTCLFHSQHFINDAVCVNYPDSCTECPRSLLACTARRAVMDGLAVPPTLTGRHRRDKAGLEFWPWSTDDLNKMPESVHYAVKLIADTFREHRIQRTTWTREREKNAREEERREREARGEEVSPEEVSREEAEIALRHKREDEAEMERQEDVQELLHYLCLERCPSAETLDHNLLTCFGSVIDHEVYNCKCGAKKTELDTFHVTLPKPLDNSKTLVDLIMDEDRFFGDVDVSNGECDTCHHRKTQVRHSMKLDECKTLVITVKNDGPKPWPFIPKAMWYSPTKDLKDSRLYKLRSVVLHSNAAVSQRASTEGHYRTVVEGADGKSYLLDAPGPGSEVELNKLGLVTTRGSLPKWMPVMIFYDLQAEEALDMPDDDEHAGPIWWIPRGFTPPAKPTGAEGRQGLRSQQAKAKQATQKAAPQPAKLSGKDKHLLGLPSIPLGEPSVSQSPRSSGGAKDTPSSSPAKAAEVPPAKAAQASAKPAPPSSPATPAPRQAEPSLSSPCLLYTSPSPRDRQKSRMPSSA